MSGPVIINDIEQGTDAWRLARCGIPTASEFHTVMAKGKGGGVSITRSRYLRRLAAEIVTGEPAESYTNFHMERGKEQEAEARSLYAFMTDADPVQVGFMKNYGAGASPDSLIGDDGGLEIKTAIPEIQVDRLLNGTLPPEHRAQVQGNLWISGRKFWDFCSYSPKLPLLIVRVHRDDGYIATLSGAVSEFNDELQKLVDTIRQYGGSRHAGDYKSSEAA